MILLFSIFQNLMFSIIYMFIVCSMFLLLWVTQFSLSWANSRQIRADLHKIRIQLVRSCVKIAQNTSFNIVLGFHKIPSQDVVIASVHIRRWSWRLILCKESDVDGVQDLEGDTLARTQTFSRFYDLPTTSMRPDHHISEANDQKDNDQRENITRSWALW